MLAAEHGRPSGTIASVRLYGLGARGAIVDTAAESYNDALFCDEIIRE